MSIARWAVDRKKMIIAIERQRVIDSNRLADAASRSRSQSGASPSAHSNDKSLGPSPVFGNQAMQRMLHAKLIQAKLNVSTPGDEYEQEADHVAQTVMRMGDAESSVPVISGVRDSGMQRKCRGCEEEEEEETLQAKELPGHQTEGDEGFRTQQSLLRAAGRPLSAFERRFFEPRFGRDFSRVRIHADPLAAQLAGSIHARAYTWGRNVVFAEGQYRPDTTAGRQLLAHELAHTIQQDHNQQARRLVMRRWDPAGSDCASEPQNKWIERIIVEQETPQSVTLHWSDGSLDSGICSTGKGHCCVEPATSTGVACTAAQSRQEGTNCTPITTGTGYPVIHRDRVHGGQGGINFWTEILPPPRSVALHEYWPVDGTPLSHGCIRLEEATARKIYCGALQNRTMVQIRGFARPSCDHPRLRDEWMHDFQKAGRQADGEPPRTAQDIRETQRELRAALGFDEEQLRALTTRLARETGNYDILSSPNAEAAIQARVAREIPRCRSTAALPTTEEARLINPVGASGSLPAQILAASQFDLRLVPFTRALSQAGSLRVAQRVVTQHGQRLWQAARQRAQNAGGADRDDRPLYWERLEMTRALRQWAPAFRITETQRASLMTLFERATRGMESVAFPATPSLKRILISGFDPFGLETSMLTSNPSGAAVLALDGQTLTNAAVSAHVEGVVFPVRFADFNAGMVESFFRPYLNGTTPVDMIMTISQGVSTDFEVEELAGRNRSDTFTDNLRITGGGTSTSPVAPPGIAAGPEFLQTTLPASAIRSALGRTTPTEGETEVTEIPAGTRGSVRRPTQGPTTGSTSVRGSGGAYLSNEIFYRTSLLRTTTGASIPLGHLHTPYLARPQLLSNTGPMVAARDAMIATIRRILEATLPTL